MSPDLDPLTASHEPDYVRCFDALSRVEVEVRRRGPSPHLLLRRAILYNSMGNYVAGLEAARATVASAPREAEGHYQEGVAWIWIARIRLGVATVAPGAPLPAPRPLETILESAYESFCAALTCGPGDDEAGAAVGFVESLLMLDAADVADALRL